MSESADFPGIPLLRGMRQLIGSADRKLIGESTDRVNFLVLGMGGVGHEGPYLTDTLIVASFQPSTRRLALLSVPRDLLVPVGDLGWRKVNSINAFGELASSGRGGEFTRDALENILGLDIPYYVRIDFDAFREIIDGVGGIDVFVERSFTDHTYPTSDFGVQTVSFEKGWQKMDGATALRFARSRHGTNGEGNDFARSKRQQRVIAALKGKALSAKTFTNPSAIADTLSALHTNVTTNLGLGEILRLARLTGDPSTRLGAGLGALDVTSTILNNGPDSPLIDTVWNGAYVLVPKNDDWSGLRTAARDVFTSSVSAGSPPEPAKTPLAKKVEIRNGTERSGMARDKATTLAGLGFEVIRIGNADNSTYSKTLIFAASGSAPGLDALKKAFPGATVRTGAPQPPATVGADFVVILGADIAD